MSVSHTKGPWREVNAGKWEVSRSPCAAYVSIGVRNKHPIAFAVWEQHYSDPEFDANARLITAAPELLGQIESAQVDLDFLRTAIERDDPKAELLIRVTDLWKRNAVALAKVTTA